MPSLPPKITKCSRKGCGKCLFCLRILAKCECSAEDKAGEPPNVMYGWCGKCRVKYQDKFQALRGNNCTYCGGDLEDNYPPSAICLAVALFPFGIIGCLLLKEKQCVVCNRTSSA